MYAIKLGPRKYLTHSYTAARLSVGKTLIFNRKRDAEREARLIGGEAVKIALVQDEL